MGWNELSDPNMRTANFEFSCDVYREGVYCADSGSKRMSTAQTPNDVIYSQWQQAILRCFGFTFLYWKEVETHHPYFFTVYGSRKVSVVGFSNRSSIDAGMQP